MNLLEESLKHNKKKQCKVDWWELVKEDMDMLDIDIDEEAMCGISNAQFKSIVR